MSSPNASAGILRLLDANANRAQEGLRVVEDHLRFVTNDAVLAVQCKEIRHQITEILSDIATRRELLAARDAAHDVGRDTKTAQEQIRDSTKDVLRANLKRVQQALRSMEEWSKTIAPDQARRFELLRYRAYEVEASVERRIERHKWLDDAWLYVLVDGAASQERFESRCRRLIDADVCVIQLRDKQLEDGCLYQRATCLCDLARPSDTKVIINDRPDIARYVGADGVHIGQDDLPISAVRQITGSEAVIGLSTHSLDQAQAAVQLGADYIGVGPTFPSQTKHFSKHQGTELLRSVAEVIEVPAFAIGGINVENLGSVLATGIQRVAVSHAVWGVEDIEAAVSSIKSAKSNAESQDGEVA